MTQPLLQASGLRMEFGSEGSVVGRVFNRRSNRLVALDGVDLELLRGEALGIVGESGSGKSTLARCLAGLYAPTAGVMTFEGRPLHARRSAALRRRIQIVFQDPYSSLNPRMTVGQVLSEVLTVHRVVPRSRLQSRLADLLDLVRLGQELVDARPRQLSGGQRQRVGIARALALEPEVLIADEPVSALDVSVQAAVLNLLADLRAKLNLTLVLIAHDLSIVRHVCSRVAVMYLGRIVETGEMGDIFGNARHPYTQGLLRAIPSLVPGERAASVGVEGDPPSPYDLPSGCRFRSRCPIAQPICAERDPALMLGARMHAAACHFAWTPPPTVEGSKVVPAA